MLQKAALLTQEEYFKNLRKQLLNHNQVTPSSLAQLTPFVDATGLIRVCGRLRYASLGPDAKHPILLPQNSHFTRLMIQNYHNGYLHAGPKLILSMIRRKFWVIFGRDAVLQFIFTCTICVRHKATHPHPMMGDLPISRVCSQRAFQDVGMDYGGPYLVKERRHRNTKTTKVYIALFICMAVKALHIEIVSDLTLDAFHAALDRFVARRGIPLNLYSDCGSNYIGASRQLKSLFANEAVQNAMIARIPCNWHFNPPAAPHMGGIWEAGIKSVKHHLKRVIGLQVITYEEMETLVIRIEGILNSRPLTPASADPHDLLVLTPGHFLIEQPILSLPETDVTAVPMNRLTRWQLIRHIHQSFWKRWSSEYLTTLQGRLKWTTKEENIKIGDLVIVEAPNRPPAEWKMDRIIAVHPGLDRSTRGYRTYYRR
ncbi:uncharacterized protein LOC126902050 [Daktulosphaira vitifoliae]|uniref:uncharacterized protein LOC126902050 n=1 Tax=Daktulosphaira vitifoliae TaxID=58002 RepID=UPI0021A9F782|nr:uncharacterized protein LOC126902050 [Daktulosphaira vitifoliae]